MNTYSRLISSAHAGIIYAVFQAYEDYPYMVRGFRKYETHNIDWEIILPQRSPKDVSFLFKATEEELFHLSCTVDYDPYEVLGLLKYMRREFVKLDDKFHHVRDTVELEF